MRADEVEGGFVGQHPPLATWNVGGWGVGLTGFATPPATHELPVPMVTGVGKEGTPPPPFGRVPMQ